MARTVTAVDFMTGILAGLALRGERVLDLSDTRFDRALASAYDELLESDQDLDVDFQVIPDRMHGDSTVAQDAITAAIESRLAGRVNPTFRRIRITADQEWANQLADTLPGGRDLYIQLTDKFLQAYKGYSVAGT